LEFRRDWNILRTRWHYSRRGILWFCFCFCFSIARSGWRLDGSRSSDVEVAGWSLCVAFSLGWGWFFRFDGLGDGRIVGRNNYGRRIRPDSFRNDFLGLWNYVRGIGIALADLGVLVALIILGCLSGVLWNLWWNLRGGFIWGWQNLDSR
jgi:hypothetical protein